MFYEGISKSSRCRSNGSAVALTKTNAALVNIGKSDG
jgi:hypothetical protein